jgi:hypothetical protein
MQKAFGAGVCNLYQRDGNAHYQIVSLCLVRYLLPDDMNNRLGPRMAATARQFSKSHDHSSDGNSRDMMRYCEGLDRIKRFPTTGW